jgi:F0F1-type ATP synthase assembly protein I
LAAELAAAAGRQSADQNTLQQQAQANLTQLQEQHAAALQVGCIVGWLADVYSH